MARITWQNVAAPDFETSRRALDSAARSFSQGFGGLGSTLQSYQDDRKDEVSQQALARLAQVTDPNALQTMLNTQGLAGLGITDPTMVNASVISDIMSRPGTLLNNANTASLINNREAQLPGLLTQRNLANESSALRLEQDRAAWATAQSDSERLTRARNIADQILANPAAVSKEEALAIVQSQGFDSQLEQAVIANISGRDASEWGTSAAIQAMRAGNTTLNEGDRLQRELQDALQWDIGTNTDAFIGGQDMPTGEAAIRDSLDSLETLMKDESAGAIENDRWRNGRGIMLNGINRLLDSYGDTVPPAVITEIIKKSVVGPSWSYLADSVTADFNKAEEQIKKLADPTYRAQQATIRDQLQSRQADIELIAGQRENLKAQLDRANRNYGPDSREAQVITGKLNQLTQALWQMQGGNSAANLLPPGAVSNDPVTEPGGTIPTPVEQGSTLAAELAQTTPEELANQKREIDLLEASIAQRGNLVSPAEKDMLAQMKREYAATQQAMSQGFQPDVTSMLNAVLAQPSEQAVDFTPGAPLTSYQGSDGSPDRFGAAVAGLVPQAETTPPSPEYKADSGPSDISRTIQQGYQQGALPKRPTAKDFPNLNERSLLTLQAIWDLYNARLNQ